MRLPKKAGMLGQLLAGICLAMFTHSVVQARVLDNFNDNTKTGWKDFTFQPGLGDIKETGGQFVIGVPAVGQPLFAASTFTSEVITVSNGRTVEMRVDLLSGNDKDSFAILSWIPATSSVASLAGYSIAKSPTDILVVKGLNKYFYNENPNPPIKNDNVTLVLSLTGSGNNVIINARVLDKDKNDEVIFEKTFVDTPAADVLSDGKDEPAVPFVGAGNFVLMGYADFAAGGPSVYTVVMDNAQTFITEQTVIDDFNDSKRSDWKDFTFQPGLGIFTEADGRFRIDVPAVGQPLFAASTKTSKTLEIKDGEKLVLQADMVSGDGKDSFAILSFIPTTSSVASLAGYSIAKSETDILVVKGLNKYFYNENPNPPIKNENVTLELTLMGQGPNVVITTRVLDKDANNAVIFERTFVDTPAADVLSDGKDEPAAPFYTTGNFVLMCYADFAAGGPNPYSVVFDNALVSAPPAAGNQAPTISDTQPAEFANFLPASTAVSFKVSDDKALPDSAITLILNGTRISSTNGLTLSAAGSSRTATFNKLAENQNYRAVLQAVDSDGVTNSVTLDFDTFVENTLVIEVEDYNFGGGQYINNPIVVPESSGGASNAYKDQVGTPEVDYHDTATSGNFPYRLSEPVGTKRSLDYPRKKFVAAGGADAEVYDYDVGQIRTGEFLNYTRSFPAGTYEVYLRESLFNLAQSETVLERVIGPASGPNQTTVVLGSFLGTSSGTKFRTVPLTDGLGKTKVLVRLSGVETLRLRQVTPDPADGSIYQNYIALIPVADAGVQRAAVSSISPADGATVESLDIQLKVVLQNRDTQVRTNTIALSVNGAPVASAISSTASGIEVSYSLPSLPPSGSVTRARLVFGDSEGVNQTNDWSFTVVYLGLDAANARVGQGRDRGFQVRVVQAVVGSALENSLLRAEDQLAANSRIPAYYTTNVVAGLINFSQNGPGSADGFFDNDELIPGLVPEENGSDDIAMEVLTYLDLPAGIVRLGARCDDGYQVVSGSSLTDTRTPPVGYHNGGPANETFEFVVPKAGLYPFRMVWYERGGGAHVEWFSVDRATGVQTLINDDKPGAIKAYRTPPAGPSFLVESSATVSGGYAVDSSAVIDESTLTITVPKPASARFYRLRYQGSAANPSLQILSITTSGETVTLKARLQ